MLIVKLHKLLNADSVYKRHLKIYRGLALFLFILPVQTVKAAKSPSDFPTDSIEASFYKTASSPFASGMASIEKLLQNLLRETKTLPGETKYFAGGKYYSQTELNPTTASKLASTPSDINNLRDPGKFMVLVDTPLLTKPSTTAAKLTKIYSGTLLKLVSETTARFQKGFVKVRFDGMEGFVYISHTVSKFDFAVWIFSTSSYKDPASISTSNNGWLQVKSRLFDEIETVDGGFIHLSQIEGVWADDTKGIISSTSDPFPLWTQIRVFPAAPVLWKSSRLPGHQTVWWKDSERLAQKNLGSDELSIDEVLKKEIFSVSFHPKNPRKALVSAGGVYHTTDGQTWKKLKQFDNFSGPVHYFNDLMLFVGPYRSVDGGKTFENFIRIDELSESIASYIGYAPQRMELRSIRTTSTLKIIMDVDIGTRKIKVQSPMYVQAWSVLKGNTKN